MTDRPRNPPAEFRLRFRWAPGFCFKCEAIHPAVTEIGTLIVGGKAVVICACHTCAWRLERQHHHARQAVMRATVAATWASTTRVESAA